MLRSSLISARSWSRTARLLVSGRVCNGKRDVTAPARGILASMESFTYLFGIMIGKDFFTITFMITSCSRAFQKESLSAVEARAYAAVNDSGTK